MYILNSAGVTSNLYINLNPSPLFSSQCVRTCVRPFLHPSCDFIIMHFFLPSNFGFPALRTLRTAVRLSLPLWPVTNTHNFDLLHWCILILTLVLVPLSLTRLSRFWSTRDPIPLRNLSKVSWEERLS